MRTEILRLHRTIASTIVYVTHDQVEAMTMSTRLAVMDRGAVLQVDAPRAVFRHPVNRTVATFIGTPAMNVLPAAVVTAGDGLAVELLGRQLPVHLRHHGALRGLKQVEAGIRPQALRLVPPSPDRIRGVVFLREPLGLEDEVLLRVGPDVHVRLLTPSGHDFPEGAPAGLDFSPSDLYLFHQETGTTLCDGIV
jgi:ABC-type sugar transport system ATPase subunit